MLAKNKGQGQRKKFYEIENQEKKKEIECQLPDIRRNLVDIQPDHDMYIHLGMAELLAGQPENALQSAKHAISINTVSYLAWYVMGCAYLDMRELVNAETAYEKAIRLRPKDMPEKIDRGLMEDLFESLQIIASLKGSEHQKKAKGGHHECQD